MNITYAPRGILQIDDARIIFRNFAGLASKFNREGDRNFAVVIPTQEIADELLAEGWNVKIKAPRDPEDSPFMYLSVKVKFNDRGPNVYLVSGNNTVRLEEDSIDCLDHIDIVSVDMDIRPYDWEVNGNTGRTAYLQSIRVTQEVDRFAGKYEPAAYKPNEGTSEKWDLPNEDDLPF
jgi:hypothetical protein